MKNKEKYDFANDFVLQIDDDLEGEEKNKKYFQVTVLRKNQAVCKTRKYNQNDLTNVLDVIFDIFDWLEDNE